MHLEKISHIPFCSSSSFRLIILHIDSAKREIDLMRQINQNFDSSIFNFSCNRTLPSLYSLFQRETKSCSYRSKFLVFFFSVSECHCAISESKKKLQNKSTVRIHVVFFFCVFLMLGKQSNPFLFLVFVCVSLSL